MILFLILIPDWLTAWNFLMGLFGLLILTGGAFMLLTLKGREGVSGLQLERANAAEGLVKLRDTTIATQLERIEAVEEELEELTSEHRTLVGIDIAKLMEFWAIKEDIEAEMADLKRQNRILQKRKDGEIS